MEYDDKNYFDQDDAAISTDSETGEEYIMQSNGTRKYLAEL